MVKSLNLRLKVSAAIASLIAVAVADFAPAKAQEVSWQGFYAGVHGGFGYVDPDDSDLNLSGGVAGGQIGHNWQSGNTVFGIEGDVSWSNVEDDITERLFGFTAVATVQQDIMASARIRVGYAYGPLLYYATVGAAYSKFNLELEVTGPGVSQTTSQKSELSGVIGGAGVEWAIDRHWSLRGEGLVSRMGDRFDLSDGVTEIVGRAALNYRF